MTVDRHGTLYWNHGAGSLIYRLREGGDLVEAILGSSVDFQTNYNLDEGPANTVWVPRLTPGLAVNSAAELLIADPDHSVIRRVVW
jgi:hypothetical protein